MDDLRTRPQRGLVEPQVLASTGGRQASAWRAGRARTDRRHRHVAAIHREATAPASASPTMRLDAGVDRRGALRCPRRVAPLALRRRAACSASATASSTAARGTTRPTIVTPEVLADLRALIPLAPLHQPYNLAAIDAVSERLPGVPQVACFDTSFHRGQPAVAEVVPLPREICRGGVQRYGFHGLSYEYIASVLPQVAPEIAARPRDRRPPGQRRQPLRDERTARASTARSGSRRSTASAWGRGRARSIPAWSSISSRVWGSPRRRSKPSSTRSRACSASPGSATTCAILLGSSEPGARLAVDYFVYRAAKEIGALAAVLGGIDGLVFTAGIGENSAEIRKRICEASAWLGIELDDAANDRQGPRISRSGSRGVGLGDPDERRTDHRPSHRCVAGTASEPRLNAPRAHAASLN